MDENSVLHKILQYGSYVLVGIIGWFFRRHVEKADMKEREQDKKLEILDQRIDEHDVSRADIKAQIHSVHQILQKMDKNIDKLLDR